MKRWLVQSLEADPSFKNIQEEARWTGALTGAWRKPDVRAERNGLRVVFEVQLATTFINEIAGRRDFYLEEGGLLIWVLARFDQHAPKLTQDDVFYNNNLNAFIVNSDTKDASVSAKELTLHCIWAEPRTKNEFEFKKDLIPFSRLTLDVEQQRAFFFDYDTRAKQLTIETEQVVAAQAEQIKLELRDKFEAFWIPYANSKEYAKRDWEKLRQELSKAGCHVPNAPGDLPKILINAIYSAKTGTVVGWGFSRFIEVAHRIEPAHRKYFYYFRGALYHFNRAKQIKEEDKTLKWQAKVTEYKAQLRISGNGFEPEVWHRPLIGFLFPGVLEAADKFMVQDAAERERLGIAPTPKATLPRPER